MGLNFRLSFLFSSLLLRRRLNFYHPPRLDNNNTNRGGHNIGHERWFGQWCLNLSTLPGGLVSSPEKQKIPTGTLFVHPPQLWCVPSKAIAGCFYYIERENEGGWPVVDSVVADTPRCSSFDPAFGSSTPESMSSVTGERYKMFMKLTECGLYVSLLCGILLHLFFFMECLTLFLFFISVFTPSRRLCYLSYNNQHTHQKIFKINNELHKVTNGQSRTAIAIMPPLFVFAVTSEQKLTHRMHEVASENEHTIEVRAEQ